MRGCAADRLLGLRVRIPPGHGCQSRVSAVLSGRGLCDGQIPRPEESYRLWCVIVCDLKTSRKRRPWPALGCFAKKEKNINTLSIFTNISIINKWLFAIN